MHMLHLDCCSQTFGGASTLMLIRLGLRLCEVVCWDMAHIFKMWLFRGPLESVRD